MECDSGGSSLTVDRFNIPDRFSRATMEHLHNRQITNATRIEIITSIAVPMYQLTTHPTSEEYTSVCKRLVEKYPVLKDSCGNGHVSEALIVCLILKWTIH